MKNKDLGLYILGAGILYWYYTYKPAIQINPDEAIVNRTENEFEGEDEYIAPKDTNNLPTTPTTPNIPSLPIDTNIPQFNTSDEDYGMSDFG